jgi:secreted trypsin-like serine protease
MVFLLIFALLSLSSALDERIINGAPATANFPLITWQVALEITVSGGTSLCGGSIIGPRHVITAGHCLKRLPQNTFQDPANMLIYPGRDRIDGGSVYNRPVARFWVEPSYDGSVGQSQRIDIGVIEVTADFDFSLPTSNAKHAFPIALCEAPLNCYPAGAPAMVSGYGQRVSGDSGSTPQTLYWADQFAVDQTACSNKFDTNFGCSNCLPRADICASSNPADANPNKDSCFGDSGGPLVRNLGSQADPNFVLVGVVSSGTVPAGQTPACGKQGEFGLYVSIMNPTVRAFIDNVRAGNLNSSAITNACVQTNTCASFVPESPGSIWIFPPFAWQWYYILAICLGGT